MSQSRAASDVVRVALTAADSPSCPACRARVQGVSRVAGGSVLQIRCHRLVGTASCGAYLVIVGVRTADADPPICIVLQVTQSAHRKLLHGAPLAIEALVDFLPVT